MLHTIGSHISRIKTPFKLVNQDARLTDRFIYSKMIVFRQDLIQREDSYLITNSDVYQVDSNVELEIIDSVRACGINTNCKFKRTKTPVANNIVLNKHGHLIKMVSSLDGSKKITKTTSRAWINKNKKSTFKYDKNLYYWVEDGYLVFPNLEWESVKIEAFYNNDVLSCKDNYLESTKDKCIKMQDQLFRIPEHLINSLDQLMSTYLQLYIQIPGDMFINKNENIKQ
jgi:hypothetical protein